MSLPEPRNSKELLVVRHLPKLLSLSLIAPAAGLLLVMFSQLQRVFFLHLQTSSMKNWKKKWRQEEN
jgi:hypothetical protein